MPLPPGKNAGFASVDGTLTPLDGARVPVLDRGLLLGDAVFETLRTYDHRLFALDPHLDRLQSSLRAIQLKEPPRREILAQWTREAAAAVVEARSSQNTADDRKTDVPECVVRVTVTRGDGPHGISTIGTGPPRVIVIARPLPPPAQRVYRQGLRVVTASIQRAPAGVQDPTIKATSALNLILARLEADRQDADEALLTDPQGRYLEASAANLFVLRDGTYWTPRGPDGVLEGVTAGIVEELLLDEGWKTHHGPIPADVLFSAEEVFLTQTTREVLPVVQVDQKSIGDGTPGEMSSLLRGRFLKDRGRHLDQFL